MLFYIFHYRRRSVFIFVSSEGDEAQRGQSEAKYVLSFNFQRDCIELSGLKQLLQKM